MFAPRVLRKHWRLTAIAVFSLSIAMALGILSLSVSNTVLLLPPAAPGPERLVMIHGRSREKDIDQISYPDFHYDRQNNRVFRILRLLAIRSLCWWIRTSGAGRRARWQGLFPPTIST
jgi:hypothetical protein